MDFENTFTVKAPIDEVYEALLDLERVAPAMPGAQVLSKTDDGSYKVAIKIKLGPVSMTYRGDVSIVERDPEAHTAVLDVKAKEARGQGTANAKVRMSLEESGAETIGTMKAQVQLAGKAAAMGRGIIEDVSARLVQTFAQNLEGILASGGGDGGDAAAEPEASAAPEEKPAAAAEPSTGSGEPEAEADDDGLPVLPLVASMVADRMRDPRVLGGVLGGVLLLGYAIGRARG
jgi:carbon monoxide dehydrogenase subunit G